MAQARALACRSGFALIIPGEIHDLLRWSDWVRAYRATAEFFDRTLAASVVAD
jgi:hypothetical protein